MNRTIVVVALLACCKSSDKKSETSNAPPAATAPEATAPEATAPEATAPADKVEPATATKDNQKVDCSWSARLYSEEQLWIGGSILECKDGLPVVWSMHSVSRNPTDSFYALPADAWHEFWSEMNSIGWKDVAEECPKGGDAIDVKFAFEVAIGDTKRKMSCGDADFTAKHTKMLAAFTKAEGIVSLGEWFAASPELKETPETLSYNGEPISRKTFFKRIPTFEELSITSEAGAMREAMFFVTEKIPDGQPECDDSEEECPGSGSAMIFNYVRGEIASIEIDYSE